MDKELLVIINLILRNLNEDALNLIKDLSNEKMSIEKMQNELSEQVFVRKKYSFLEKNIFKKKEYQEYLNNLEKYNQEYGIKNKDYINRLDTINDQIYKEKCKSNKLIELIDNPTRMNISVLKDYFNSYQEIETYCNSKNIKLNYRAMLFFGKQDNDLVFMDNAINEDFRTIIFDKSYSLELYKIVIDKINEFVKKNFDELSYNSNLGLYNELVSGKYDGHFIKHVMDYIKYICIKGKSEEELKTYISKYYFGLSSKLSMLYEKYKKENLGGTLEKIYENDDMIIGCHATSYIPEGDIVENDSIFENGIRAPIRGDGKAIDFTVAYNIPFLEVLDYDQNRYGSVSGGYAYILTIPKDVIGQEELLWGKGEDGNSYILPKYVYGKYKQFDNNAELILNSNSKKKTYEDEEISVIKN